MRVRPTLLAALFVALIFGGGPARACMAPAPLVLADVKYADVVVIGRISNYRLVLDPIARDNARRVADAPELSAEVREMLLNEKRFLTDYAKFDIAVDEVLIGTAAQTLTVTWDNSTFAEPESVPAEAFVIALRNPRSGTLPLRGPSATIMPNAEPGLLTVPQAPCSTAFLFATSSDEAREVIRMLKH